METGLAVSRVQNESWSFAWGGQIVSLTPGWPRTCYVSTDSLQLLILLALPPGDRLLGSQTLGLAGVAQAFNLSASVC